MRGHNITVISGNIGGSIVSGKTKDDRSAFSFGVCSQNEKHRQTWVRINCYDKLADYCVKNADKGLYVSVVGELMNRDGKYGELTEVRAQQVIFYPKDRDRVDADVYTDEDAKTVWDTDSENK